MTDETLNNYVLKLSLPIQAPSLAAAAETFLDEARSGTWAYTVDTPDGRSMAEITAVEGRVIGVTPITALTALYFVDGQDEEGDDISSIVEAISPEEAERLWKDYWADTRDGAEVLRIFRLPQPISMPRVIPWHSPELPVISDSA